MKQQLISTANFILLCILLVTVIGSEFTKVVSPINRTQEMSIAPQVNLEKFVRQALPISQLYGKRNIFGLTESGAKATKNSFDLIKSPTLSELKLPEKTATVKLEAKNNIIDPLNIALNGIIISSNDDNNACIISNSSNQEKMYRVGDMVQDGTILDITSNSVAIIRPNGQIETFKIIDSESLMTSSNPLSSLIQKTSETTFVVDPVGLSKHLNSLGQFVEELGIMPHYEQDLWKGLLINRTEAESLGALLGLSSGDLVTQILDTKLDTAANRINVYDKILAATYGTEIKVNLKRNDKDLSFTYKLDRPSAKNKSLAEFLGEKVSTQDKDAAKSKDANQKDDKKDNLNSAMTFIKPAEDKQRYNENISSIRKRLLENANRQRFGQPR